MKRRAVLPCLLLVLTIGLLLPACKSDADKYDEALTLMLEQDYERAAGILDGIMNYKDSAAQKAECDHYILYNAGLEDIAAEKYETAQVKFKALSEAGFLDSGRLLEDCKNNISYNEALSMMEQGDADSAMNSFLTLGNFKDSKTRVIECQNLKRYSDAVAQMQGGDVLTAMAVFEDLGDFRNSSEQYAKCLELIDDTKWQEAVDENSYETLSIFLKNPDGKHYKEAYEKCDDLLWAKAQKSQKLKDLQKYLDDYPRGKHLREARTLMEERKKIDEPDVYDAAVAEDTIVAMQTYINDHPGSGLIPDASKLIETMKKDTKYYKELLGNPSEALVRQFLADYPGHVNEKDAKKLLGQYQGSLTALRDRDAVSFSVTGSDSPSTQKCSVSIQNQSKFPVTVTIPLGTYFTAKTSSVENMLVTREYSAKIPVDGRYDMDVDVASMNISGVQAGASDKYSVAQLASNHRLVRLLKKLKAQPATYPVTQAATWIITDNPTNKQLVNSIVYADGTRVINKPDVKQARKLVGKL